MLRKAVDKYFGAWKKHDQDAAVITVQSRTIYILLALLILCLLGWMTAPSRLTVYIPPDISNGATEKAGSIPRPLIYSFAFEIWQEINYWPNNGMVDYAKNVHTYWSYLTPEFEQQLLSDASNLQTTGQSERRRAVQGLAGSAYQSSAVKPLSNNSWEVDITLRLTEYANGQVVKDVEILYPLKVVRSDVSRQNNPYGLQLAGFVHPPQRIVTYV